jgi:thiamine pyrophosphate-dependent acetolactate synthase large subunit-like protein
LVADWPSRCLRWSARLCVRRIYGVVGDSLNRLVDAIRRGPGIEGVHVRNEEAGALVAAGGAQLTGRLAVCGCADWLTRTL